MKDYKNPQQEISTEDEFGRPDGSNKMSITIDYLAEHYVHKYKAYWFVVDKNKKFIKKVKDKEAGQRLINACGCQGHWRMANDYEPEERLAERTTKMREQYQGTHKMLDIEQRRKSEALDYDRTEQTRMDRILRKQEKVTFKREILHKIKNNHSLGEMTTEIQEIVQEVEIKNTRKNLLASLL